jgi:hypothetical protein
MDVLAANPLATALAPYYVKGGNLVRAAFLDPRLRDLHADWEHVTEGTVAGLRALVGPDVDDPRLNELVGTTRIDHALVGRRAALSVPVATGTLTPDLRPLHRS